MKTLEERQCFLISSCQWGYSSEYSYTWNSFNIYLSIIYFVWYMVRYIMRQTCLPPNVTKSTKLGRTQCYPELAFRSKHICIPENLNFQPCYPINPIQDGGGGGGGGHTAPPPTKSPPLPVFPPVTSTNVGISPKTLWILVLSLLLHWCKISSLYLTSVPNYRTWTTTTRQKNQFFWWNTYKLEVMIILS